MDVVKKQEKMLLEYAGISEDSSPELRLEGMISAYNAGGQPKQAVNQLLGMMEKVNYGIQEILLPLLRKFKVGSSQEIITCCDFVKKLKKVPSIATTLADLLDHKHTNVQIKAAEALSNMENYAVPAESKISEIVNGNYDKSIQKILKKLHKKLGKINNQEKEMIIEEQEQIYNELVKDEDFTDASSAQGPSILKLVEEAPRAVKSREKELLGLAGVEVDSSPEKKLDSMINAYKAGGNPQKAIEYYLDMMAQFNYGIIQLTKPIMQKLELGTTRDIVVCCAIIKRLKKIKGIAMPLAELLKSDKEIIRNNAVDALLSIGNSAVIAQSEINDAFERESSKDVKKLLKKLITSLGDISTEEKEITLEEERKMYKLFTEVSEMENDVKKIDISSMQPSEKNLSQYKNVFFMSHALPDFNWVKKAIDVISTWPDSYCWTCEKDIKAGEDWLTEIYTGLEACTWYLLFWSENAENSNWTNEEIKEAKTRNVATKKPKISTANLDGKPFPVLLKRNQGAFIKTDEDLIKWLNELKGQVFG